MMKHYMRLARPDHWFKNVFMLPGILLGWVACGPEDIAAALLNIGVGIVATCLITSANYTINEWLDAPEDRQHPEKRNRPAALGLVKAPGVYIQWVLLAATGLFLAWMIGWPLVACEAVLLMMGLAYNVKPVRLKDWPYVDVLSESVNNPLRLLLGWYTVPCHYVPPISLVLGYWMIGAFFMAIKRFAELRHIGDRNVARAYRRSFGAYTPERLLISIVFYATASAFFGGIFMVKYHMELILAVPFLAGFMAIYMWLGFLPDSPTQRPERLYRNKPFMAYTMVTTILILACMVVRFPWLHKLFESTLPKGF